MRIGTSGTEGETAASLTFVRALNTKVGCVIDKHVGMTGLDTGRTQFVVTDSTGNTLIASVDTSFAFWVAGFAHSVKSKVIGWASLDTNSFHGISEVRSASSTVAWVLFASCASRITCFTVVHGGFVETVGTLESTDSSDHHVGTFIIA